LLFAYLLDRLERLSKKKANKKLKRLFSTLLVIDSSEIRGKKKRLHLLYEAKVLLDFEVGNNREVEHAEVMLEEIEGSILLPDRR
jgi:reverse gyrase